MRTAAIIQARMGSSRFPGKVLRPLAGKPVLWHIVHRLRKCRTVDVVALATSTSTGDDPLEAYGRELGVEVVRGPEDNVLERYRKAALSTNADIVVRITGDAPLLDPAMMDELVDTLVREQADYCVGQAGVPCIHEGFAPFTRRALEKLGKEAADDPVAREHVDGYMRLHPELFRIAYAPIAPRYQVEGVRVSVDTPADLAFLETVYQRLEAAPGDADIGDVADLLREDPGLRGLNAHVRQKTAQERTRRILFRYDADGVVGFGHAVRCLAIADELRERHGWGVTMAMRSGPAGADLAGEQGFHVELSNGPDEAAWLTALIQRLNPDILFLDLRTDLPRNAVHAWQEQGVVIATLDDPSERRLAADLAFYPPVPQVREMNWDGFRGVRRVGWDWVPLRRQFCHGSGRVTGRQGRHEDAERTSVLVTMGGSDPAGLTLKTVEALNAISVPIEVTVVVGRGFSHRQDLDRLVAGSRHRMVIREDVTNMRKLMTRAQVAVASFGVTAYELAACGTPAIYLCLSDDHAMSAQAFVQAGFGLSLGVYSEVSEKQIADSLAALLDNPAAGEAMGRAARAAVDGCGARRIAQALVDAVAEIEGGVALCR